MHKSLALLALFAVHLCSARSFLNPRIPAEIMEDMVACQKEINPTPCVMLHCRKLFQELDIQFQKCCLPLRRRNIFHNCLSCVPLMPDVAADSIQDGYRTVTSIKCRNRVHNRCLTLEEKYCQRQRRN